MGGPATHSDTPLTYDDFLRLPDDGKRHEIIGGVHYVTPSPNRRHQRLVGRLYFSLASVLERVPHLGEVFLAPFDVVLSDHDVVEPDLLFIAGDQPEILTPDNVNGPPALVIEVLSKRTRKRDAQIKRQLFARTGVREYWMVDPDSDTVQIFRASSEGPLAPAAVLAADDDAVLTTPLLPGWTLPLQSLFRQ
jgi:Uma2 family endonuclease